MKKYAIIAAGLTLSACAQKPEAIAPAYVSPMTYSSMNCEQMRSEAVRVDNALVRASAQQNEARQADTVGVILLGLPVSSLSGGNVADQIAHLKGQKDTLEQSQIAQNCIRLARPVG
jgi:hypothetical protein